MIIDGHAHACGEYLTARGAEYVLDSAMANMVTLCPQILGNNGYPLVDLGSVFKMQDIMLPINKILKIIPAVNITPIPLDAANHQVFLLHQQLPKRVLQFYWVNPEEKDYLEKTKRKYEEYHYIGIKVHQCVHNFQAGGGCISQLAKFAAEKNIPFFLHLYNHEETKKLIAIIEANPKTTFIIAHLIGMEVFEAYGKRFDNVYFDTSPVPVVGELRVLHAIACFGADKILLGSDTPFGRHDLLSNIKRIIALPNIKIGDKKLILGENMERILGEHLKKIKATNTK